MNRDQLLVILASVDVHDVRQIDAGYPVWILSAPGLFSFAGRSRRQAISFAKLTILRALLDGPSPVFVLRPNGPVESGVVAGWCHAGPQTYRLEPAFDLAAPPVDHWLFVLGHWCVYAAPTPVTGGWPDPFRLEPTDL